MIVFLSVYIIGLIGFIIHAFQLPRWTKANLNELFLLYQLVFSVGITSILAFIGLTFMDVYIAEYTNWPLSPFQQELGNVNLASGVLGIMCIWFRRLFWVSTIFGFSIWILGDGFHHLYEIFVNHNYSDGNLGAMLYTDLLIPPVLLISLYYYYKEEFKKGLSYSTERSEFM